MTKGEHIVSIEVLLTRGKGKFKLLKERAKRRNFMGALNTLMDARF